MNTNDAALWDRIRKFPIDRDDATLTFTARLARENGWTRAYAKRVVEEYKRFMFLTVTAGQIVTPSEDVDHAWHLHLTYTRSYWIDFCQDVLGRKVHHDPTRGFEEQAQFIELYQRTLDSYRRAFDCEPPADIWPNAETRFGEDLHGRWVNVDRNWVIPKPQFLRRHASHLGISCAVVAPSILAVLNPFDFNGPQFLLFYGTLFFAALILAIVFRKTLTYEHEPSAEHPLSAGEAAFLIGGTQRAIEATVAGLIESGAVTVQKVEKKVLGVFSTTERRLVAGEGKPIIEGPLEQAIYTVASQPDGASATDIGKAAGTALPELRESLTRQGLVGESAWQTPSHYIPGLIMASIALVGAIKIVVGLSRDKPVVFLVLATIATILAAVVFMVRKRVTTAGKAVVEQMKARHASLASMSKEPAVAMTPTDVALAVALFGATTLAIGPYAALAGDLEAFRKASSASTVAGGCGGGCGGGGCGGGGCGGGGCGGCGG